MRARDRNVETDDKPVEVHERHQQENRCREHAHDEDRISCQATTGTLQDLGRKQLNAPINKLAQVVRIERMILTADRIAGRIMRKSLVALSEIVQRFA